MLWVAIKVSHTLRPSGDGQAALAYLLPILMAPIAWALVAVDVVARAGSERVRIKRSPALLVCWMVLVLAGSVAIVVVRP